MPEVAGVLTLSLLLWRAGWAHGLEATRKTSERCSLVAEGVRLPSPFTIYAEDFKGGPEL